MSIQYKKNGKDQSLQDNLSGSLCACIQHVQISFDWKSDSIRCGIFTSQGIVLLIKPLHYPLTKVVI